jgi:SnoaL-like domain
LHRKRKTLSNSEAYLNIIEGAHLSMYKSTQTTLLKDTKQNFNIEEFKALYSRFDSSTPEQLGRLYSRDVVFIDPVHQTQGLDALKTYFAGFCSPETACQFNFYNQVVTAEQAFVQWTMNYSHARLNHGKTLTLNGGTLIKFTNLIHTHEDFYDMGAMIYQHIPLLGWAVKKINRRIAGIK